MRLHPKKEDMFKQVIVVRKDLKLSKGKLAVQVAHASIDAYKKTDKKVRESWESEGAKKVVVAVDDLKQLLDVKKRCHEQGLSCSLISDAGRTELPPGTTTVLGIGPCKESEVDKITGKLKML
ncbi:MAG: peptidyl-tRNA hydrolase Pth2 [Nanoarchaeota archaeon]